MTPLETLPLPITTSSSLSSLSLLRLEFEPQEESTLREEYWSCEARRGKVAALKHSGSNAFVVDIAGGWFSIKIQARQKKNDTFEFGS